MADLSFLEKFSKGNAAKMKKYVSMYLATAPESFKKMEQNIKDHSWDDLAINAHSLKPQAEFMGIPKLKEVLNEIEINVKKGKLNELDDLYEKASSIHHESMVFLRNFLERN